MRANSLLVFFNKRSVALEHCTINVTLDGMGAWRTHARGPHLLSVKGASQEVASLEMAAVFHEFNRRLHEDCV